MKSFADTLEDFLDLREALENPEDNFLSINDRSLARQELYSLKDRLNDFFKEAE